MRRSTILFAVTTVALGVLGPRVVDALLRLECNEGAGCIEGRGYGALEFGLSIALIVLFLAFAGLTIHRVAYRLRRWLRWSATVVGALLAFGVLVVAWRPAPTVTLQQILKAEGGNDFGPCGLHPAAIEGRGEARAVLTEGRGETPPAHERDSAEGSWEIQEISFVLIEGDVVTSRRNVRLPHGVNPREVISIACAGDELDIVTTSSHLRHTWDGERLTASSQPR